MAIKSKKWYQTQISALEAAARNTARFMESCDWTTDSVKMSEIGKRNSPIQKECREIYTALNQLRAEYSLYYR